MELKSQRGMLDMQFTHIVHRALQCIHVIHDACAVMVLGHICPVTEPSSITENMHTLTHTSICGLPDEFLQMYTGRIDLCSNVCVCVCDCGCGSERAALAKHCSERGQAPADQSHRVQCGRAKFNAPFLQYNRDLDPCKSSMSSPSNHRP